MPQFEHGTDSIQKSTCSIAKFQCDSHGLIVVHSELHAAPASFFCSRSSSATLPPPYCARHVFQQCGQYQFFFGLFLLRNHLASFKSTAIWPSHPRCLVPLDSAHVHTIIFFGQQRFPEAPVSEFEGGCSGVVAGVLLSPTGESRGNDRSIFLSFPFTDNNAEIKTLFSFGERSSKRFFF